MAFYTWNDGNVVTADDARSLADALELALQDPPMLNTRQDDPAAGWFSDDNKASMLTFIALCRSGCFVIC